PRVSILEENDSLYFNTDKHYTQGLRIANLFGGTPAPDSWWDNIYDFVGVGPIFEKGGTRRTSVFVGQSIFTPKNLTIKPPDPKDRPYAGWAYIGASLLQETHGRMLENVELDFGMVGPGTLAKQAQNDFHKFIGAKQAQGWSDQIQHEFGGMLSYERYWKLPILGDNSFGVDFIPDAGATVAVGHRLFRRERARRRAGLVLLRRGAGPRGRPQHLPRWQHLPRKPPCAEKEFRRRRAGRVLGDVDEIAADRFHRR